MDFSKTQFPFHNSGLLVYNRKKKKILLKETFLKAGKLNLKRFMFVEELKNNLNLALINKKEKGAYKAERIISTAQGSQIKTTEGKTVLNFCSNNYLGLANHPAIIEAVNASLKQYGFGMASVRFICGTTVIHKELERSISNFLNTEDTLLYSSCFDANGGVFENLLGEKDVIISASLNHASIIDGTRLSKAQTRRYQYNSGEDLDEKLRECANNRFKVVVTDGVFSMEGELAPLDVVADLCKKHKALLVVDDSHATGIIGEQGKGTASVFGVHDQVDLFTGTLGKALGGGNGGYISGRKELIDWFRNSSRPYLFSNSIAPPLVSGAIKSLEIICSPEGERLRNQLATNTDYFRKEMIHRGFKVSEGVHPIIPIILGESDKAAMMADKLLKEGIYVIGFSYPVVPENSARIRVQISATHTMQQISQAIEAFTLQGKNLGVIP